MLPVPLLCAALVSTLLVADLLSRAGAEPESFTTDERGFVDTAARCDKWQSAVAVGRTEHSLVAICTDGNGQYEYRGVRVKDSSVLDVPAEATEDGQFVAENGPFTYTFSAKELVIDKGWFVLRTEPMVAFVEPRRAAGG
jgi:hypothetical protein